MLEFLTTAAMLAMGDQSCKKKVEETDSSRFPIDVKETKGLIRLYRNHNHGFSFGFLKEYPKAVEYVPLCAVSALAGVWLYVSGKRGNLLKKLGLTMALAGGASNVFDRFTRGYVVDYLNVRVGALKKLVFNLGDLYVTIGAVLFALSEILDLCRERR